MRQAEMLSGVMPGKLGAKVLTATQRRPPPIAVIRNAPSSTSRPYSCSTSLPMNSMAMLLKSTWYTLLGSCRKALLTKRHHVTPHAGL